MPFDSTPLTQPSSRPLTQPSPRQLALDQVLAWLGPNGENWSRENCAGRGWRRGCVVNAIYATQRPSTQEVLLEAVEHELRRRCGHGGIGWWNDHARDFTEVRDVLLAARALL
jgi:hypothetical protein